LVDSEVMMGMLHQAGGDIAASADDAEILVVNTCSFIDSAKQESVNTILEMVQHKKAHGGKAQRLIVAGCLVERYRDEIQKNIPEVDAVVGTGELESILAAAGLTPTATPTILPSISSPRPRFTAPPAPSTSTADPRATACNSRSNTANLSPLAPKATPASVPGASPAPPGREPPPPCPSTSTATPRPES
jgi:ribosomal protein S12 methylthiotransferase